MGLSWGDKLSRQIHPMEYATPCLWWTFTENKAGLKAHILLLDWKTTLGFHAIVCNLNLFKTENHLNWRQNILQELLVQQVVLDFSWDKKLKWDLFSFDINLGVNEQHTCRHIPTKVPRKYSLGGTIFYHLLLQFHTFPSTSSPPYWQESHIGWGNVTSILRLIENSSYLEKTKRTLAHVSTLAISTC